MTCECGCGNTVKFGNRFINGHNARGKRSGRWLGGRTKTQKGYVLVYVGGEHPMARSDGYALEHRVIFSESIGRSLEDGEIIHHIDGNKENNEIDNLELWAIAHPAGVRVSVYG